MKISKWTAMLFLCCAMAAGLTACSDDDGYVAGVGPGGAAAGGIGGAVGKGPVGGAALTLWYYNADGVMQNLPTLAPVTTLANGTYSNLRVSKTLLGQLAGTPILIKASGGKDSATNLPYPDIWGLIPDASELTGGSGKLTSYLSAASSVAARMYINAMTWDPDAGATPQEALDLVGWIMALVNDLLGVDLLNDNPLNTRNGAGHVNLVFDYNLGLLSRFNPAKLNYDAIADLIEYLALNLGDGALDGNMYAPGTTTTHTTVQASFSHWANLVAALNSGGPADVGNLDLEAGDEVFNYQASVPFTITLNNGVGEPVSGAVVTVDWEVITNTDKGGSVLNGPLTPPFTLTTDSQGQATFAYSNPVTGQVDVYASYPLSGTNNVFTTTRQVYATYPDDVQGLEFYGMCSGAYAVAGSYTLSDAWGDAQVVLDPVSQGPVSDMPVQFSANGGGITFSPTSTPTSSEGFASVYWTGTTPGTYDMSAQVTGKMGQVFTTTHAVDVLPGYCDPLISGTNLQNSQGQTLNYVYPGQQVYLSTWLYLPNYENCSSYNPETGAPVSGTVVTYKTPISSGFGSKVYTSTATASMHGSGYTVLPWTVPGSLRPGDYTLTTQIPDSTGAVHSKKTDFTVYDGE